MRLCRIRAAGLFNLGMGDFSEGEIKLTLVQNLQKKFLTVWAATKGTKTHVT